MIEEVECCGFLAIIVDYDDVENAGKCSCQYALNARFEVVKLISSWNDYSAAQL